MPPRCLYQSPSALLYGFLVAAPRLSPPCSGARVLVRGAHACRHTPPRPHVGGSFRPGTEMSNSNGNCDPAVDNRGKNDRPTRNTGRSNPSPELSHQITPYLHTLLFPGSAPSETGIALLTSGSLLISRQRIKIIDIRPHPRHLGGTRKIALVGPCCASVLDFRGRPAPDGSLDTGHGRIDERAKLPLSLKSQCCH